mgnify:CR=1 FL=1|jgi:hypothetical protein
MPSKWAKEREQLQKIQENMGKNKKIKTDKKFYNNYL